MEGLSLKIFGKNLTTIYLILILIIAFFTPVVFLPIRNITKSFNYQDGEITSKDSSYIINDFSSGWNMEYDSIASRYKVIGTTSALYLNTDGVTHSESTTASDYSWDHKPDDIWGTTTIGDYTGTFTANDESVWLQMRVTDWYVMYFGLKFANPSTNRQYTLVQCTSRVGFGSPYNENGHLSMSDQTSHPTHWEDGNWAYGEGYTLVTNNVARDYQLRTVTSSRYGLATNIADSQLGGTWLSEMRAIAWRHQWDWFDDGVLGWDLASVAWNWLEYYGSGTADSPLHELSDGDYKLLKNIMVSGSNLDTVTINYKVVDQNGLSTNWIPTSNGATINAIASDVQIQLILEPDSLNQKTPKITQILITYDELPLDPIADIPDITMPTLRKDTGAGTWVWEDRSLWKEPALGKLIVESPFTVDVKIANPRSSAIDIVSAYVSYECSEFGGVIAPQAVFLAEKAQINPHSNQWDYVSFKFSVGDFDSATWDDWTFVNLKITFEFSAVDRDTGLPIGPISIETTITLIKPPPPVITFDRFEGPKDNPTDEHFIYKTDEGELSQNWAVFKVQNDAWIPIKIFQVLEFEPIWLAQDEDPDTGEGFARLLDIQGDTSNPVTIIAYPGQSEIRVRLDVLSAIFFAEIEKLVGLSTAAISAILMAHKIITNYLLWSFYGAKGALLMMSIAKPLAGKNIVLIEALLVTLKTLFLVIPKTLFPVDLVRNYQFSSSINWEYQFEDRGAFTPHTYFGYVAVTSAIADSLQLKPSQQQLSTKKTGETLGWISVGLSIAAIVTKYIPFGFFISLACSIGALVTSLLSGAKFSEANDPPLLDSNYTEVVEPSYRNITVREPESSFESSIYDLTESSIKLEGNLEALNVSVARSNSAKAAGDNESLIKQYDAINNHSSMVSQDLLEVGDNLVRFSDEFNNSITEDNITQVENSIIEEGISEEDRGNLTQLGYNETEIAEIEDLTRNMTRNQSISLFRSAFRNISKNFAGKISNLHNILKKESQFYEELSQDALNESITLKNTTQNKPITTADPATQDQLKVLYIQATNRLDEGSWSLAIELATYLKNLALDTIDETLNQSYFFYVEEADKIIKLAEEKMKIELIPSKKEIPIKAGVPETLNLIVLNTGAPSGIYKLISNSSWIQPMIQEVDVVEWKSTKIPLTIQLIESFDIEPGEYPINLTIYLEGTETKKTIIITIIVVSTKVENMLNYIFYEIAGLREEVDARVSFLFDWMIINRLDAAECLLNEALEAYLDEAIPKSVVLDKLAKVNIELSDVITIILDWIGFISEEDGDFISTYLHTIRDHITLTMGVTVGTEEAMIVAEIETKIEQLADQIFTEYCLLTAIRIDLKLWTASESLDFALLWMAVGCGDIAELHIILSIQALECAKCQISDFKAEGKIPADEADALLLIIDGFIAELEPLHTHYTHEGDCGGGDMHTHQGTEENNNAGEVDSSGTGGQSDSPMTEMPTH